MPDDAMLQTELAGASMSAESVIQSECEGASPVKRSPGKRKLAIVNLCAVLLPPLGLIGAIVLLWGVAFSWLYLLLMAGMGLISAIGITVGYHRLCTHKSFKTPGWLRYLFAAAGSRSSRTRAACRRTGRGARGPPRRGAGRFTRTSGGLCRVGETS